jgi:hypothetical protein
MKTNLCRLMAAILLGAVVFLAGCATDPYAPGGPDMGTAIPAGGTPASGTGDR